MLTINSSIMNKVANGKLFVNDTLAGVGDTIKGGDVVRLVADDGYMVKVIRTPPEPYLGFKNSSGTWVWAGVGDWIVEPLSVEMICPTLKNNASWLDFSAGFDVNPDYVPEPEPEPVPVFTFTQDHIDAFTNANAKLYIADVLVTVGTGFFTGDVLTAKADDGYKIQEITYRSPTGGINYFTVTPDELTATSNLSNFGSGFNVSTEIDAPVPVFTFTQDHIDAFTNANAKIYIADVLVTDGTGFFTGDIVTAKADDGYKIQEITYRSSSTGSSIPFTVTPDELTATSNLSNFGSGFNVSTEIDAPVPVFTFTQDHIDAFTNANAKIYIADVLVTDGTGFFTGDIVTAKADDGYKLNFITYRSSSTGSSIPFTVAPDELTATSNLSNFGSGFTVETVIDAPVPVFTFTQDHIDAFTNANAKIYIADVLVTDGTGFFTGDIVTAKADDGYTFSEVSNGGASVSYRTGSGSIIYFELGEPAKTATSDLRYFNSGFNVETIAILPDVKGYNNVYALTDDQLRDVTQSRFVVFDGLETIDYGKYIIGLIDLPFDISPDIIKGASNVKMGAYNSEISATLLKTDTIRLNLGDITVPLVKNSLLDYKNTVAILHLPYANAINVDLDYVIGQTVNIEYVINLYDGLAVINLSSSKLGDVFLTVNVDMDISIPFANIETFPSKNDGKNISLGGDNGVKIPYFEIMRNNALLENGFFTIPIIDETLLSEQNGFIKIDEIDLKVKASKDEKEMILNAINQGVIIK